MRRARLIFAACLSFLLVISGAFWKKALATSLCGLLFFNSAVCYGWLSHRANAAVSHIGSSEVWPDAYEIAIPPIIRDAPIDLQGALANDFIVSQQTPYSSGRNEVLIVSPSTGTEQRFEINLPGTGDFRLYEASFSKVSVSDPNEVLGGSGTLSASQIQTKLSNFKLTFGNNEPSSATLADGTTATFSDSETVIRSADGQVIETVPLSGAALPSDGQISARAKSFQVAQAGGSCQVGIRDRLYAMSQRVRNKSIDLSKATSAEAKLLAWVLTFGTTALEDSLVADTRNQTLQEVACEAPVQCNAPQSYEGGWETRTDLFQLPGGNNGVTLQYEFYRIEDRIELWRDGELLFSRGPTSGNDSVEISDSRLNGTGYVGVKVIGNPTNQNTLWNYTIACQTTPPCEDSEIQTIYDTTSSSYHSYTVRNIVCSLEERGCSQGNIFTIMLSQSQFIAPDAGSEPVTDCKISVLDLIPGPFGNDTIRTSVNQAGYSITNYTREDHVLHPGRVTRSIVQEGNAIIVTTFGEGTGLFPDTNERKAPGLWSDVDKKLIQEVQRRLNN